MTAQVCLCQVTDVAQPYIWAFAALAAKPLIKVGLQGLRSSSYEVIVMPDCQAVAGWHAERERLRQRGGRNICTSCKNSVPMVRK